MKTKLAVVLLAATAAGQPPPDDPEALYRLALSDRKAFAAALSQGAETDFGKARAMVDWLARNFEWTATDYQTRTVDQILERRGGNCYELAVVTNALLDEIGARKRQVREINLHVGSEERQRNAEAKIREVGNRASVFGRRHNDHVWLEVYDEESGAWYPADPSMGVVGLDAWIEARAGFGDRKTLDPTSDDMIVPMGIFILDRDGTLVENRTGHYLVDALDAQYGGRLSALPGWPDWVAAIDAIDELCLEAFRGETNLHEHEEAIARVARAYERLREQASGGSSRGGR